MDLGDYLDFHHGLNLKITKNGWHERAETIKTYVEILIMMKKDFNLPVDDEVSKLFNVIKGDVKSYAGDVNLLVRNKVFTNFINSSDDLF